MCEVIRIFIIAVAEMRSLRVGNPNVHELNIERTDRTEIIITELQELTNFTKIPL